MRKRKTGGRSLLGATLVGGLLLVPLPALGAGQTDLTDADLVLFPIPPNPIPAGESVAKDLSDLLQLSLGDHYQITTQINSVVGTFGNMGDPANPETWDVFNMEGQFRFLVAPDGGDPDAMVTLVLLGFRKGPTVDDPPADIGYVFDSFTGAPPALFVSDESGDGQGQIQDLFGNVFLAFQFATTCDPCSFEYQIAAREPLSTIQSFNTAFLPEKVTVIPEPGTFLLLALGLAGLVFLRR